MANAKETAGKLKRVKIDGYFVDIPKGLPADNEAALLKELSERIANDETLAARRQATVERRERFEARRAKVRADLEKERLGRYQTLGQLDNPNG